MKAVVTARHLLVPFLILLAGCEATRSELSPEEAMGRVVSNLVTTCEKDPAEIALAGLTACSTDEDCAAEIPGTFCNLESARCDSQCDGVDRLCGAGEACDCAGRCVPAESIPTPPPVEPPTLSLSTQGVDLVAGAAPQAIDLKVVTKDVRFAPAALPRPPLEIYLHVERPAGLPENQADAIQISCSANPADQSQYTSSCGLTAWTFSTVEGKYQASGRVFVRRNPAVPVSTTSETTWDIAVLSAHTADGHDRVSVAVLSSATVPREGNYAGTLTFAPEPGTSSPDKRKVTMPVKAWVSADGKVMLNGNSLYLPYHYIRLTGGGYNQNLAANYPVAIDTPTLTFINDPRAPRITGKLTMSLPLPSVAPASNKLKRSFDFELTRTGKLTAKKCPCTAEGYVCDQSTQMCFKANVPAPVAAPHDPPEVTKRHAGLKRWASEGRARLGEAIDSLNTKLFGEHGGIYSATRSKASGTADLMYDVAGFDFLREEAKDLGYKLCRAYFPANAGLSLHQHYNDTCANGPRATNLSDDCPSGSTWKVDQWGRGECKKANGDIVEPNHVCAALFDVNRQGFGHTWGPEPKYRCPKTVSADLAEVRRDYVPCFHGKIYGSGPFGDLDTLDSDYDYVINGKDYSCRSMAKRAFGQNTRPTNDQFPWFMVQCKTTAMEVSIPGGPRGVLYLCPFASSLVGPYASDAAAEHMQCLAGTASNTQNLNSERQLGAALPVSGDAACGSKPPTDVNLYHLRDKNPDGTATETQSSLFWSCIADLERDETAADTWQQYLAARTCISPERFLLGLEVKTAGLAGLFNPGTDGGDAKLVRSLQQWLGVTGFVMTQGIEEMALARAISSSAPPELGAMTWARLEALALDGMSLMLDPEVQKLLYRYPNLAKIVGDASAPDFDRTVALPVSLLNAVSSSYGLIEALMNVVREAVYVDCMEGGASQARTDALGQAGKLTRVLAAAELIAVQLYSSAGSPSWDGAWSKAVDRMSVAREKALTAFSDLQTCKNPLGIPENYVPLFFIDAQGANQRYFGSSDYLLGQARQLVAEAKVELEAVRNAWLNQRAARFQDKQSANEQADRRNQIERAAGTTIADLCGVGNASATTLFARFDSGNADQLTQANCYFKEAAQCQGANRSIDCYRGAIGEAAAAMVSAETDIELARMTWVDTQAKFDLRNQQCARIQQEIQGNSDLLHRHHIHMSNLRLARRSLEAGRFGFGVIMSGVKAYLSSGASAMDSHEMAFGRAIEKRNDDMADAEAAFQEEMAVRLNDQKIKECFDEVDNLHIGISTAFEVIKRREQDALAALVRFKNAQARLGFAVLDAHAALEREDGRAYVAISHHHWLPEKKDAYQLHFRAAKRVAYLALLALEYDMQQSLIGRNQIMAARTPVELEAVVGLPGMVNGGLLGNFTRQVAGQVPEQLTKVVSLSEILGYATPTSDVASKADAVRRLRAHLTSPEAAMYDRATGEYLGQGIRFSLTDLHLPQRCGERIWRVAASVHNPKETSDRFTTAILFKDRNFATQACTGDHFRHGTTRDELGLLVPRLKGDKIKTTVKAVLSGEMNVSRTTLSQPVVGGDYPGSSNELRLMGVYGEYVLLFPVDSLVELQLGSIEDVFFRFDYLSVGNTQEPL